MLTYIMLAALVNNMGMASPDDTEPKANPIHEMYVDLKARGYTMPEIADKMAESEQMRETIMSYPLEDCYKAASGCFIQNTKTCASFPKTLQAGCYSNAQEQLNQSNKGCLTVYITSLLSRCSASVPAKPRVTFERRVPPSPRQGKPPLAPDRPSQPQKK